MITLTTLAQASEQEIFDQVTAHLLAQNARSSNDSVCLYRDPVGHKCAAGCLIADDEYRPEFEGTSWVALARQGQVPGAHAKFIRELQNVHDIWSPPRWLDELRRVARDHNLKPGVLA